MSILKGQGGMEGFDTDWTSGRISRIVEMQVDQAKEDPDFELHDAFALYAEYSDAVKKGIWISLGREKREEAEADEVELQERLMASPWPLFMGNGRHSNARCGGLLLALDRAFGKISGMQQGGYQEGEWEKIEEEKLLPLLRTIAVALFGDRGVDLVNDLPPEGEEDEVDTLPR